MHQLTEPGHQLTEAGMSAMAEELHRLASGGSQSWDQATRETHAQFREFIDSMLDKARDAEAERLAAAKRQVAAARASGHRPVLP
jgi:hypothetical protein